MNITSVDSAGTDLLELPLETLSTGWGTTVKVAALKIASYLTDPICKVREYVYTFYTLDKICKTSLQKTARVALLALGILVCAALTPFTTPLGIALRGAVASLEPKPYTYLKNRQMGKILPVSKEITLLSHNQCYMPAGYSITDGQVTPPSDKQRIDANIQKMRNLNPDIICLYEVADICDAEYLSSHLPEYPFVIPVAGVRAVGPSSMMYIASKYEIVEDSIAFIPFIKGVELTGRARFSEKGVLSFDIKSPGGKAFTTLFSTHLQHSEIPADPKEDEQVARAAQMDKIARQIQKKVQQGCNVIFTGDLNQSEEEIDAFFQRHQIHWLRRDPSVRGIPTWGGDQWCAQLMGKPASGPQVLDYTFVAGKVRGISTKILGTGYCGAEFRPEATSDHDILLSTISLG